MQDGQTYENIFIARQPILTADNATWGHLMLFRDSEDASRAIFSDDAEATMKVIANMPLCPNNAAPEQKVLVHFPTDEVIRGIPHAVPCRETVIIVEEDTEPSDQLMTAIAELKKEGFYICVNNYTGTPGAEPLVRQAEAVMIESTAMSGAEAAKLVQAAHELGVPHCIAKRLETPEQMKLAMGAGFDLFHGFFFQRPIIQAGRTIASSQVTRLKLFEIIERDEPDFDALAPAIEADVSISYRLLNFLNSAAFSFATTITSIRQAVVLAGWKPIRNWLRLIILTDLNPSEKTQELTYLSAHRAKLFETAALGSGFEESADKLFMLGLFSLLDAMLSVKMDEIVSKIPVDQEIKDALCGKTNRYTLWLKLAQAIESSDWDNVGLTANKLGLEPGTVAVSYQHAFTWADSFFGISATVPGGS